MSSPLPATASVEIPWRQRLSTRVNGVMALLGVLTLALVIVNLYTLTALRDEAEPQALYAKGRMYSFEILFLAQKLVNPGNDDPAQTGEELRQAIQEMDTRYRLLEEGDPAQSIHPISDAHLLQGVRERHQQWDSQIQPTLVHLIEAPSGPKAKEDLATLERVLKVWRTTLEQGVVEYQEHFQTRIRHFQVFLYFFVLVVFSILGLVLWLARGWAGRIRALAQAALQIAGGDLHVTAPEEGGGELGTLARAFNAMTGSVRDHLQNEKDRRKRGEKLLDSVREAVTRLTSASAEILSITAEQTEGAQQQAAAVTQTVTTVDQVTKTANQATERAKGAGDTIRHSLEIGQEGQKAVDDSVAALDVLKDQVESTAKNIVDLAEQAQAIGEIIASVNDIAEQTNLLALNAAIEASRAGEHGKGFSVVASEVKALADQSKKATGQVRQILGEIQKATNTAVLSTEEVTKGVEAAIKVSTQTSQTINTLAEALEATAQASVQIVASAGQQASGMTQIHQAMTNLDQVTRQNLAATRQVEQAAQNLNALGSQLAGLTAE